MLSFQQKLRERLFQNQERMAILRDRGTRNEHMLRTQSRARSPLWEQFKEELETLVKEKERLELELRIASRVSDPIPITPQNNKDSSVLVGQGFFSTNTEDAIEPRVVCTGKPREECEFKFGFSMT